MPLCPCIDCVCVVLLDMLRISPPVEMDMLAV
jgi:hypothetical protein